MAFRILPMVVALIIGAVIGGALVSVFHLRIASTHAGDWLQFLGTAFAVIVSSLLTLWIERRNSTAKGERDFKLIGEALRRIRGAVAHYVAVRSVVVPAEPLPDNEIGDARHRLIDAQNGVIVARRQMLFVMDTVTIVDLDVYEAMHQLRFALEHNPAAEMEIITAALIAIGDSFPGMTESAAQFDAAIDRMSIWTLQCAKVLGSVGRL